MPASKSITRRRARRSAAGPLQITAGRERDVAGDRLHLPLVRRAAIVRSQQASRITWHRHEQFEMLLMLDGSTSYEFDDGRTVDLPGGHFLVIPPGLRHRGLHDIRRPARLCGLLFDPRSRGAARHTPLTPADLRRLTKTLQAAAPTACPMSGELRRVAGALARQLMQLDAETRAAVDDDAALELRVTLCAAVVEAARQLAAPRTVAPTAAVQAATAFLDAHLGQPISMRAAADAAGCSRARLFALFKQQTGLTPNDYLLRARIARSQHLLATTERTITDIALAVGFSTSQYFSNVFRKYTGRTPTEFRQSP
ncbi:MAG: AraC family transcriptional regulator [Pirellulales bacterium]